MNLLDGLNPQQTRAVMATSGAVLVLAGPGSGKTRVLTHSIAYRIGQLGARPFNILAVTFTNRAAREMKARIEGLMGESTHGLTLGTFHGICVRILRREADKIPFFDSNFVIFDSDDQIRLIKQALRELDIDEKQFRPHSVHGAISRAKNELCLVENFPVQGYRDEVSRRVYERYQELLQRSNAVDFDDLLLWTVTLLEQFPAVREKYARRYEHILVDEFQDTNIAQYQLLEYLSSYHKNMFAVGDADQSIYRWRGADYRNVRRFEEDFPEVEVILLEQNYRSSQNILNVAMDVINKNGNRTKKDLFSELGKGQKITVQETYDDRHEAQYVVDTIAKLLLEGYNPGDFAVMYRTNAQSRLFEDAFGRAQIPHKLVGAQRFYGRKEIKDMISYLRLVHNPKDEASLSRVINVPPRRIGKKTIETLWAEAERARMSAGEMVMDLSRGELSSFTERFKGKTSLALGDFGALVKRWRSMVDEFTPLQLLDQILAEIDYESYVDTTTQEGLSRWENVQEFRRAIAEYSESGLLSLLENMALVSDQDTLEDQGDQGSSKTILLTLHASKGLEFPIVFIVGLEDDTLPHARSLDDPEGMAEERRLFYVGITRAAEQLFLVYANERSGYGTKEEKRPSRFLEDISPEHLHGRLPIRRVKKQGKAIPRWDKTNSKKSAPKPKAKTRYRAGMNVRHKEWGDGMVLISRVLDGNETVDIFFAKQGLKRVDATLANLEIIGD